MKLVAINIIYRENMLMNPDNTPILYYWDGKSQDLTTEILQDQQMSQYIVSNLCCADIYDTCKLCYFTYTVDEQNQEQYEKHIVTLQDVLPLYKLSNADYIYFSYTVNIFNKIYKNAMNKPFENDLDITPQEQIIDIYKQVKAKYGARISVRTILEYIRSQLSENTSLSQNNINFIYQKIQDLLTEDE